MRQPSSVAGSMGLDPMFRRDDTGKPVARDAKCECGREFTQRQLSERFLEIVEKQSRNAMQTLRKQIPDFFVPVHCPRCERRDLGRQANLEDARRSSPSTDWTDHAAD